MSNPYPPIYLHCGYPHMGYWRKSEKEFSRSARPRFMSLNCLCTRHVETRGTAIGSLLWPHLPPCCSAHPRSSSLGGLEVVDLKWSLVYQRDLNTGLDPHCMRTQGTLRACIFLSNSSSSLLPHFLGLCHWICHHPMGTQSSSPW